MSAAENKVVVLRFNEAMKHFWRTGDAGLFDEVLSTDYVHALAGLSVGPRSLSSEAANDVIAAIRGPIRPARLRGRQSSQDLRQRPIVRPVAARSLPAPEPRYKAGCRPARSFLRDQAA
jgi:hypothetical protein